MTLPCSRPPSREANPFATCWTRPGAMPYVANRAGQLDDLLVRLASTGWRGQIVGPHGAGKSALLLAITEGLKDRGVAVAPWDANDGGSVSPASPGVVLAVEGFERLSVREQRGRLKAWRSEGLGFVVTTHRPLRDCWRPLPVLASLMPDEELLRRLFDRLTCRRPSPVAWDDARRAFARRRGRLRDVWFDLYDLHERHTRGERTVGVTVAYSEPASVG